MAQKVSSVVEPVPSSTAASRATAAGPPSWSANRPSRAACSSTLASGPRVSARACRTTSASVRSAPPPPYGWQPVTATAAPRSRSAAENSAASRDLPTPGSPSSVNRWQLRCATDRSQASSSCCSSSRRPISRALPGRLTASGSGSTPASRQTASGCDLPLTVMGSTGCAVTYGAATRWVTAPSRMPPSGACCSSRAATFTVSPETIAWPSPNSREYSTSPVFTPIRSRSRARRAGSSAAFSPSMARCMSQAARTPRSTSSSCTRGTPKTAITASPMNFSTVPPCRSRQSRIRP